MEPNKNIHHANIVLGEEGRDIAFEILKKDLSFNIQANPDFLLLELESFGIDDARGLSTWAIGKAIAGAVKVCFISAGAITLEAQNALLKVLEEPTEGTYIFMNFQNLGGILPTLISRVRILNNKEAALTSEDPSLAEARAFLRSKIGERLATVKRLAKKESKKDMKELIWSLEALSGEQRLPSANQLLTAKIFASARGASPKMLLEWLACVI